MLTISPDSYIRLTYTALQTIPLEHLISSVDEELPANPQDHAMLTTISGYTEWLSRVKPGITLGWDWQLSFVEGLPELRRINSPRSNLMLVDEQHKDLGEPDSSALLAEFIDQFDWQTTVWQAIQAKYQA